MITRRIAFSSVSTVIAHSSFSTLGCSVAAAFGNDVHIHLQGLGAARLWVGGTSSVTTGTGVLVTSGASTVFRLGQGEALWGITSAAVGSTYTALYTNQPV